MNSKVIIQIFIKIYSDSLSICRQFNNCLIARFKKLLSLGSVFNIDNIKYGKPALLRVEHSLFRSKM